MLELMAVRISVSGDPGILCIAIGRLTGISINAVEDLSRKKWTDIELVYSTQLEINLVRYK